MTDIPELTDEQFAEIRAALFRHKMIYFRGQTITHGDQESFSRRFGRFAEAATSVQAARMKDLCLHETGARGRRGRKHPLRMVGEIDRAPRVAVRQRDARRRDLDHRFGIFGGRDQSVHERARRAGVFTEWFKGVDRSLRITAVTMRVKAARAERSEGSLDAYRRSRKMRNRSTP